MTNPYIERALKRLESAGYIAEETPMSVEHEIAIAQVNATLAVAYELVNVDSAISRAVDSLPR